MATPITLSQLTQSFYAGEYSSVASQLGRSPLPPKDPDYLEKSLLQIGSLIFLGDYAEAEAIFGAAQKRKVDDRFLSGARFYLGIGLVRLSKYSEAQKILAGNLNSYRRILKSKNSSPPSGFFCLQGAAFFHFFRGQFHASRRLAEKSLRLALEENYPPGQEMALDLLGHTNCQLGNIRNGLANFEKALKVVTKLGSGGAEEGLRVAILKFRAQSGINFPSSDKELRQAIRALSPEDTYSKGELILERSRQLVLRGRVSEAKALLDESSDSIYRHRNRRQSACYNLRYSHILLLRGEPHAAMALLRTARANLDPDVDKMNLRQIEGLEWKIQSTLPQTGNQLEPSSLQGAQPVNMVDERILRRHKLVEGNRPNSGEDPLGDKIDEVFEEPSIKQILRSGLLGLTAQAMGVNASDSAIYLGPDRGQALVFSQGDVRFISEGITKPMAALLQQLNRGGIRSKQSLVEETWGYRYKPSTHDRLLHATIGKIRTALEEFSHFVEWSGGGYSLKRGVFLMEDSKENKVGKQEVSRYPLSEKNKERESPRELPAHHLNHRQVQALKTLRSGEFLGVTEYSKRFKVCKMTACRDLTRMVKEGLIVAYGKARATKYGTAEDQK